MGFPYYCHSCYESSVLYGPLVCTYCGSGAVQLYEETEHEYPSTDCEQRSLNTILEELFNIRGNVDGRFLSTFAEEIERLRNVRQLELSHGHIYSQGQDKYTEQPVNTRPRETGYCSICLTVNGIDRAGIRFACGHHFHRGCAESWLRVQKTCPNCRAALEQL